MTIKLKRILIISSIALSLIAATIICVFIFTHKNTVNLDGCVANLANYKSIGIGYQTEKSNNNVVYADELNSTPQNTILIGVNQNNLIEKIKFTKEDNEIDPSYNIMSFNQTTRYILITYTQDSEVPINIHTSDFHNYYPFSTYLIDKVTGLTFKLDFSTYYYLNFRQHGISSVDCIDKLIIYANQKYYKVGVENDKLVVNEFFNNEIFNGNVNLLLSDKFGNCILSNNKVYTKNGQIKSTNLTFDQNTYRGFDGLIHHENYVLTEDGTFVETIDNIQHPLPTEFLIYRNNNDYYFYSPAETSYNDSCKWYFGDNVVKLTKTGDSYTIKLIPLNFSNVISSKIVVNSNYIYAITGDYKITKVNFLTEQREVISLNSNIILNKIKIYNANTIEFAGVNDYLNAVHGTIKANGNISYSYTKPEFECFTIMPLSF